MNKDKQRRTMRNYILYILTVTLTLITHTSCDSFLDVMPDNRTMLDSPQKIKDLLVTSYPTVNYALVTELSGDNLIDNRAENATLKTSAYDRMDTELFEWQDVSSSTGGDSPYSIWESYYQAIASANQVLEAIENLQASGDETNMDAQVGEALMIRAYSHFMLVNIFAHAYKDSVNSANDLGITYMLQPERQVTAKYTRNSVAEVYELIAKDIEKAFQLIDDDSYEVPAYHFTTAAAAAFASQFYLYKRDYEKAIAYADYVLGTGSPTSLLRSWQGVYSNAETQTNVYIAADNPANLLLLPTYSVYVRRFARYRYSLNGSSLDGTVNGAGPNWSGRPPFLDGWIWTYGQEYGLIIPKVDELFEYTDKVARIGYPHIVRTEFTTDDVLLNRAEAKIMLGQIDEAVVDLQYWNQTHKGTSALTKEKIEAFYLPSKPQFVFKFHTQEMSPDFIVTAAQKPFIDCVLHFRRLERLFEGQRWFDLKRYGIEITRKVGRERREITLKFDDENRAIQIPQDVVGAGLTPNPRFIPPLDEDLVLSLVY